MSGKKRVESGHKVVTDNTDVESKTALDDLINPKEPYQTDMAPLTQPEEEGSPDAAVSGNNGTEESGPIWDNTPPEAIVTEGNKEGAEAAGKTNADGESVLCKVTLKNGATYGYRGTTFRKGVPVNVSADIAARLLRTGMFAKG